MGRTETHRTYIGRYASHNIGDGVVGARIGALARLRRAKHARKEMAALEAAEDWDEGHPP